MRYVALTAPFLVVLLGESLVVGLLGDRVGDDLGRAMIASPQASEANASTGPTAWLMPPDPPPPESALATIDGGGRWARIARGPDAGVSDAGSEAGSEAGTAMPDLLHEPSSGSILVPRASVERAMRKKDIGAANALAPDGSPLGARLGGVSRYSVGLRDGDVVVSVEGARTRDVGSMVTAALGAAAAGGSAVHGRILRGNKIYEVILEIPDRTQ